MLPGCIPSADPPPGYRLPPRQERDYPPPPAERDDTPPPQDDPRRDMERPRHDEDEIPPRQRDYRRDEADAPLPEAPPPEDLPAPPRSRPVWEARPVSADAREVRASTHTVAPGETLHGVSERTGASVEAIARANDLSPPYELRAGQRLAIPGGRYHLVRAGESGIAIARAYGIAWSRIVDANGLADPYTLRVGERLLIPSAPSRASVAAERARAFSLDIDDILTGGEPALAVNQAPSRPVATPSRVLPPNAAVLAPPALRGGFIWPADGKLVKRFGRGASGERLDGVELAVREGSPVHAAADGVVAYAGEGIAALGGLVIVRHGQGWTTVYGHASKLLVARGQAVKRGQTIALAGDTGFTDRPELHFELRKGRTPVDPVAQLPQLPHSAGRNSEGA